MGISTNWEGVIQFRSFVEILAQRAMDQRDRLAFVFLDGRGRVAEQTSFTNLHQRVAGLAGVIHRQGYSGQNLLLALPTGLEFVVALFACFRAGAVAVPIPSLPGRRSLERAQSICRDAQPAAVLTLAALEAEKSVWALDAGGRPLPSIAVDRVEAFVSGPEPHIGEGDIAFLQYTSGSTADPKGVMLTHGNLLANSQMIAEAFGHDETLRGVGWLPLFHDMGLIGHVLQPVYVGGLSVLMSPLSFIQRPIRWLEAISTWRATTSGGPSHAYALCADRIAPGAADGLNLDSWRTAYCGSEPVRGLALERFAERFATNGFRPDALQPCYGLAEATLLATSRAAGDGLRQASPALAGDPPVRPSVSCGRPWGNGTIRIADVKSGQPVGEGDVGEICVIGPHVAAGYWGRARTSADVFHRESGFDGVVLRTGDLGFMREGELFVSGRIKDTLIVYGEKHAAEDIEETVSLSDPLFAGASGAAFAIIGDGVDGGEIPIIVQELGVKQADGDALVQAARNVSAAVIRAHDLRLADVALVRHGTLPRTSSGKIRRGACRDLYRTGKLERLNAFPGKTAVPAKAPSS